MVTNAVLSDWEIRDLLERGAFVLPYKEIDSGVIQPSTVDLSLGDNIWKMRGGVRPLPGESVEELIGKFGDYPSEFRDRGLVLERSQTYLAKAQARFNNLSPDQIIKANPKSSSGRVDLQVRLLADGSERFDKVRGPYMGDLWVEINPGAFGVVLRPGTKLNQIRFAQGNPVMTDDEIRTLSFSYSLVNDKDGNQVPGESMKIKEGLVLSLDLGDSLDKERIVGYVAKETDKIVDLGKVRGHDWRDYFDVIYTPKDGSLTLEPGKFYILSTKEAVSVPPHVAGDLMPSESSIGNYTVHYAGFVDPGFGFFQNEEKQGNTLTLEVRVHDRPEVVRHDSSIAVMKLERMSKSPNEIYGGGKGSNYSNQIGPRLAKYFK